MHINSPYKCTIKNTDIQFIPMMIDYVNECVWWQKGQASGDGTWYGFTELNFETNELFVDLTVLERDKKIEELLDEKYSRNI